MAYSDDLRRYRFIHCVGDLLASLPYPHLLNEHARRSQNRAPHSGRVALFKRRGARTARGMDEVRVCKAGVIKVWMMGRCFVWNFLGVPNFFSEGGREIFFVIGGLIFEKLGCLILVSQSTGENVFRILLIALLAFGVWKGYEKYQSQRPAQQFQEIDISSGSSRRTRSIDLTPKFQCDGRTHCSQMTSCEEATFFLKNCPGTKMDGNNDGVPCEQQWCK